MSNPLESALSAQERQNFRQCSPFAAGCGSRREQGCEAALVTSAAPASSPATPSPGPLHVRRAGARPPVRTAPGSRLAARDMAERTSGVAAAAGLLSVLAALFAGALAQGELYTGSACTTRQGAPGACALFEDCPSAADEVRRGLRPRICAFDGFTPVVCCAGARPPAPAAARPTPTPTPTPAAPTQAATPPRGPGDASAAAPAGAGSKSRQKCEEYGALVWRLQRPAVSLTPFDSLVNTSLCQVPSLSGGQPFVIGGKNASLNEFPHMAAVGFGDSDRKRWLCGGALISERFVLTAAHCLEDKPRPGRRGVGQARWVRLGDLNLYSDADRAKVQEFSVVERIAHPEYRDGIKYHDIGLLRLDRAATFDEAVRPACLQTDADALPDQATATGWGAIAVNGPLADTLQKINLPLVRDEECRPHFDPAAFPLYAATLPRGVVPTMVCAGGEPFGGRDTCQGDSGGPLQVLRRAPYCAYSVVGVTSFGKSCAKPDTPAVYSRVASYVPWIESVVWP